MNFRQTVGTIRSQIVVDNPRDTYLFNLSFSSQDPRLAERIVNSLAQIYIDAEARQNFEAGEKSIGFISDKVTTLEEEIRERENDFAAAQAESDVINREALEGINVQFKNFRDRLQDREITIAADRALLAEQQAAIASRDVRQILAVFADPVLCRLAEPLANDMTGLAQDVAAFESQLDRLVSNTENRITQGEREQLSVSNCSWMPARR